MNKGKTLIEWSVVLGIAFLCLICSPWGKAIALEFQADKNVALNFTVPIGNLSNSSVIPTGLNNTAFYVNSNDNTTYAAAATNVTHISSGVYLFQLNATEMNHDHITAMYNGSSCWQFIPFNTVPKEAIDAKGISNLTTADLGGLTNVTLAATQTGVTIPTVTSVTNDVGITQAGADKAWGTATRQLTGTQAFNTTGNLIGAVTNVTTITGNVNGNIGGNVNGTVASIVGNVGGNITGSVASVTGNVTVTNCDVATSTRGTSNLTASDNIGINWADVSNPTTTLNLSGTTVLTSCDGATAAEVWDYNITAVNTTGYAGTYVKSAASADDPWTTDVSTGYAGQAGEYLRKIRKSTAMIR